ncbi:MAG TPA: hypothetical protein VHW60_15275 [Caulobacteraceae bacterium]|jgi:hypothetical protein|nr:hypothetical protein [Caulobacteraceae bacterium]
MRAALFCLTAGLTLIAGCSRAPAPLAGNAAASNAPTVAATTAAQANSPPTAQANTALAAAAPPPSGAAVSGVFSADGQQAALTQVIAYPDEPYDGKPVTALVFTTKDQAGDPKAEEDALFGNFGNAIVAKIEADGTVVSVDVVHSALQTPGGAAASLSGVLTLKGFSESGGQISGDLTTGGPTDLFDHKLNIDLTFHVPVPSK